MSTNGYFTLTHTTYGTKRFYATWPEASPRGWRHPRTIQDAVTGNTMITLGPKQGRKHELIIRFDGTEAGDYGTYDDLVNFWAAGTVSFQDWETGTPAYDVVFLNSELALRPLEPHVTKFLIPVKLQEVLS